MFSQSQVLAKAGLSRYQQLRPLAVHAVLQKCESACAGGESAWSESARQTLQEDFDFHLEFLRPVLEFGLLQPMVDYLLWLESVHRTRALVPAHIAPSLDWFAEFFLQQMPDQDGALIAKVLGQVKSMYLATSDRSAPARVSPAADELCAVFTAALLGNRQDEATAQLHDWLDSGRSLVDFELHVIQPALYQIGEDWQANRVSVAQEHLATAIAHDVMSAGMARMHLPTGQGRSVLLACAAGNQHSVGLRMVADAFALAGWKVVYLGADVPVQDLVEQTLSSRPALLGLSVSLPSQLQKVRETMGLLDEKMGALRPPVIVGGLAINRFAPLVNLVGAQATGQDARAALTCADAVLRAD